MKGQIRRNYNYIKIIKDIDIKFELEKRGIEGAFSKSNLLINCPVHGEKNPSFGIKIFGNRKGLCQCFSCGWKGNLFSLISVLDNVSYDQAIKKYIKNDIDVKEILEIKNIFTKNLKKEKKRFNSKIKYYKKSFLDKFKKPYGDYLKYLLKERKLTNNIINKFNILCCDGSGTGYAKIWKGRIIIPIIDYNDKFVGVTARYIYECDKSYKMRKIQGSDISKILFGLKNIKKGSPLIGVEGEIDVIYLQQFFVPAIRTGKFLSKEMIKQILNFTGIYIHCMDGDIRYFNKKVPTDSIKYQKKELIKYITKVKIIRLPEDKDPNDLSHKEIKKYFGKYINKDYFYV